MRKLEAGIIDWEHCSPMEWKMWQTAGVVVILAVVLVYVARQVIRMVRSKTPACCGCIGCSGLEETPGPREGCERP
jgi:hypothetical protein